MPETYLLPATNLSILPNDENDAGIVTESNINYEYTNNDAIYDYYNNEKSILTQEQSESYVLTESQQTIELSTYNNQLSATETLSGSSAIQLTPEKWLSSVIDYAQIEAFNAQVSSIRVIYEFELDAIANSIACLNNSTTQFLPLNDILDVCVKSMFKKAAINYAIPGNLLMQNHEMIHSKNIDQYFVFDENPISFCQFKNDAFVISQLTTKQPYRLQSNLYKQIRENTTNEAHSFELVQDDIETILYKNAYDSNTQQYNAIDKWTPAKFIKGIGYNYIVELEQNVNQNRQYDNPTIYSNGDIFGYFTLCKNMYDSLYSMHMDNLSSICKCRSYCDIQSNGNTIALKYYDDLDYYFSPSEDVAYAKQLSSSSTISKLYPYQKVEILQPINFGKLIHHKSNLFSLKISNSGLDEQSLKNYDDEQRIIAEQMKKDIANSIKALANSIAPANTQLFATYFIDAS